MPEHVGLTVSAHPPLFWFVDEAPPAESWQVFTLIDENRVTPIVEATIAAPDRPGIQRIDLAARDIELVPGVEYKWSVAIVEEPRRSPLDNVSFGWILRVEPPAGLEQDADAGAFAALGLWYDALAAASEEESGGEQPLRDALLEQVGLGFAVGAAAAGNSH